jgi:putative FmdB family regulatory protein
VPIYEYECEACHYHFEELQPFTDQMIKKCPQCGGRAKRHISKGAGLIFKGSGFYATDYAQKNSPGYSDAKKESATTDKKEGTVTESKKPEKKTASKDE